jgi:hypothetical protein
LINKSLGITGEEQALPQDNPAGKTPASSKAAAKRASGGETGGNAAASPSMPVADEKKQQALAEAAMFSADPTYKPTLIDSEMETLYAGFQKPSRTPFRSRASDGGEYSGASATRDRKMQREEAKVRALNSNGRVDYSIQEGVFDISLLASIASHLSYWADEDVNHFMIGQLLKRGREKKE